jgi:MoaD family protein
MRIEVEVSFSFKHDLEGDYRTLDVPEGCDVECALRSWVERHPTARERVFDASGGIRRHVNALVNGGNVTLRQGFRTKLRDGDRLTILPPAGGG